MLPYPLTLIEKLLSQTKNMNAHLALQARLHDLEENEKAEVLSAGVESEEGDEEASVEAEVKSEEVKSDSDDDGRTHEVVEGDSRECMHQDTIATEVQYTESKEAKEQGGGGHTPGEVWTESPHFLWGP
jgi:hypothetical protein